MENNQYESTQAPQAEPKAPSFLQKLAALLVTVVEKAKGLLNKLPDPVKNFFNKVINLPKKIWIMIGGAVGAVIVAIIVISLLTNTYKTPVTIMQQNANAKKFSSMFDQAADQLNGFATKDFKAILKVMKSSEDFEDMMEEAKEAFEEEIEEKKENYGDNYKYKYKVTEKEALDKDDVRDFKKELRNAGKSLLEIGDEVEDYDSDDWEDVADALGVSKSNAKKLVKSIEALGKTLKGADVTAGYELTVTVTLSGSELDEPEEDEITMIVYKVNGRWVSEDALETLVSMGGMMF